MTVVDRINNAIKEKETFYVSIESSLVSLSMEIESEYVESLDNESVVFYMPQCDTDLKIKIGSSVYENDDDWIINEGPEKFIISFN